MKELRGFLGLSGYYRKFVRNYGVISQPLTHLLRKGVPFVWTSDAQTAFDILKQALTTALVLVLPDFSQRFDIETDACDSGVGAVLLQRGHPLAFVSRGLGPRTRGLSTYQKEYMAILLAVEQWRILTTCRILDPYRSLQSCTPGGSALAHSLAAKSFY